MVTIRFKAWVLGSLCLYLFIISSCTREDTGVEGSGLRIDSPDGQLTTVFHLKNGIPFYSVMSGETVLLNESRMGLRFHDGTSFDKDLSLQHTESSSGKPLHSGDPNVVSPEEHRSLLLTLQNHDTPDKKIIIDFRLYNDKIKFRYQIPAQSATTDLTLEEELTEFSVADNFDLNWGTDSSELQQANNFRHTKIVDLNQAVEVPLMMSYGNSFYMTILEEPMPERFEGMKLINNGNNTLKVNHSVRTNRFMLQTKSKTFLTSPWRVIKIADKVKAHAR